MRIVLPVTGNLGFHSTSGLGSRCVGLQQPRSVARFGLPTSWLQDGWRGQIRARKDGDRPIVSILLFPYAGPLERHLQTSRRAAVHTVNALAKGSAASTTSILAPTSPLTKRTSNETIDDVCAARASQYFASVCTMQPSRWRRLLFVPTTLSNGAERRSSQIAAVITEA